MFSRDLGAVQQSISMTVGIGQTQGTIPQKQDTTMTFDYTSGDMGMFQKVIHIRHLTQSTSTLS